jgi:hypothetical protein
MKLRLARWLARESLRKERAHAVCFGRELAFLDVANQMQSMPLTMAWLLREALNAHDGRTDPDSWERMLEVRGLPRFP